MTPEAQRIAIAEACGWEHRQATREQPVEHGGMRLPNHFSVEPIETWWNDSDSNHTGVYCEPPRYLTDLNAMHEAEMSKVDIEDGRFIMVFREYLHTILGHDGSLAIHATAAQRAEAFLKTIGRWTEDKA